MVTAAMPVTAVMVATLVAAAAAMSEHVLAALEAKGRPALVELVAKGGARSRLCSRGRCRDSMVPLCTARLRHEQGRGESVWRELADVEAKVGA